MGREAGVKKFEVGELGIAQARRQDSRHQVVKLKNVFRRIGIDPSKLVLRIVAKWRPRPEGRHDAFQTASKDAD